jgi:hypothetical protein
MDNELTKEEFQTAKQKLKDRQYEISKELLTYDKADDKFIETTEMLINIASAALETFKSSETPKKREMLNFVFQNLELKGSKLLYKLAFPFDVFEKTTTCTEWRGAWDELRTFSEFKIGIIQLLVKPKYHV